MTRTNHAINFKKNSIIFYKSIYHFSKRKLTVLKQYLTENKKKDWIRKFKSLIRAPILFILKKDRNLRLYVDYRSLNKITIKNKHTLPLIEELINRLSNTAIYIKLNIKNIYHRIRIRPNDKWKTAFRTRYGHYKYIIISFNLTNTPVTFQAYINEALKDYLDIFYITYLDNICIYNRFIEKHEKYVRLILKRFRQYKLYAKLSKYKFSKIEIQFLGYIVRIKKIQIDSEKMAAIIN
jgi:hypothetical protein